MSDFDSKRAKNEYRALASNSLKQAQAIRKTGGARAETYAALELRHAFEALIYERAIDYLSDLSSDDVGKWQPQLLLKRIVEIDPIADQSVEFSVEKTPGKGDWLLLGHHKRIGLSELKDHYFALGSFLHAPSLASMKNGRRASKSKINKQCDKSETLLADVLSSTLQMSGHEIFGRTSLECSGCGTMLSRSLAALKTPENDGPLTKEFITVDCQNCSASFSVFFREGDGIVWREQRWQQRCSMDGCDGLHVKWHREVKEGGRAICSNCGTEFELRRPLVLFPVNRDAGGQI